MASIMQQCFFLISFLMMIQVSSGRFSMSIIQEVRSNSAEKVSVSLYYESLCPDCSEFIVNGLAPIFENGLIDIVDLKLIPWGNAKVLSNNSFVCQHGPDECFLNTVEACAINAWPKLSEHFPFIKCVEGLAHEGKKSQWETCFKKLGLDDKPVKDCYTSGYGKKLELKYAAETAALQPPHEYVPWITVNKQPLYEESDRFTSYICKAYKGSPPRACRGKSYAALLKEKAHCVNPAVYYADVTTEVPLSTRTRLSIARIMEA